MAIDVHAHYIPPGVLQQVKQDSSCGVEIAEWGAEGPQLRFGQGSPPSRPIITILVTDIAISARFAAAIGSASAVSAFSSAATQGRDGASPAFAMLRSADMGSPSELKKAAPVERPPFGGGGQ